MKRKIISICHQSRVNLIHFAEKVISISVVYICSELEISGGKTSHSGMAKENIVVTVTCLKQKNYVLFGEKEVTCQSTGWSHDPLCRKCGKSQLECVI